MTSIACTEQLRVGSMALALSCGGLSLSARNVWFTSRAAKGACQAPPQAGSLFRHLSPASAHRAPCPTGPGGATVTAPMDSLTGAAYHRGVRQERVPFPPHPTQALLPRAPRAPRAETAPISRSTTAAG